MDEEEITYCIFSGKKYKMRNKAIKEIYRYY
jgi:hypothetical protein